MKAQFTPLYKHLRPRMNKEERREFVRELQKCIDRNGWVRGAGGADFVDSVNINARALENAFRWVAQPQGFNYWRDVHVALSGVRV